MKTKIISARVPLDVAEMVENACKHKGVNKSQLITRLITAPRNEVYSQGGELAVIDTMDEGVRSILSAGGGLAIGLLIHNVLKTHLPTDRFHSEESRNDAIILCTIAAGMGAMLGINKLIKSV